MSIFKNMSTEGLEEAGDRLGGFQLLDTDIYVVTIKHLFAGKSDSGAQNITIHADIDGTEFRETVYISTRTGEHFYVKNGKKNPLPGFTNMNDICLIATGKELFELDADDVQDKTINLWDFDAKKELPTSVPMILPAIGKTVALGIQRQMENKRKEVGGKWQDVAEYREFNTIDKVFHPEHKVTVHEARNQKGPEFWDKWLKANQGKIRDKRTIKDGQAATAKGGDAGPPKAGAKAPRPSLFD